jgi:hypothetical protein
MLVLLMGRFMKYAVVTVSTAMIYIPGFMKTGSGIHKLIGRIHTQTGR